MKDQQARIVAAIAAYLDEATTTKTDRFDNFILEFKAPISGDYKEYLEKLATDLAAAITPHLEAGSGWEDAPSWAEWRTVDKHGAVLYWENEPIHDDESGFWVRQISDVDGDFEYGNHLPDWKNYKQQRPH